MPCARSCAAAPTWRPRPACAIVGGHSIDDREPKYGLAVTGTVHPDRLVRNSTARAGDELWLTKPVGGGVASTAMKRGTAPRGGSRRAVEVMTTLNARGLAHRARGRRQRDDRRDRLRPARPPARDGHGERRGGRGRRAAGARDRRACWSCSSGRSRRWPAAPGATASGSRRSARLGRGGARGAALAPVRRDDLGRAAGGRPAGRRRAGRAHRPPRRGRGGPDRRER